MSRAPSCVNARGFYYEWSGHPVDDLEVAEAGLRRPPSVGPGRDGAAVAVGTAGGGGAAGDRSVIFLAGDSSMDNKYWVLNTRPVRAVNGFEVFLRPDRMFQDVCYWMNRQIVDSGCGSRVACLNTAVEASTLGERSGHLLPQDVFIRENIRASDTLVVSVGGNDIALRPSLGTIFNMLRLAKCTRMSTLEAVTPETPMDRLPGGYAHFVRMFRDDIRTYVERITERSMPGLVVVCLIYFPDELTTGSWADFALGCMGYNKEPRKLQLMIRTIFEKAIKGIRIEGTTVVPFPLFECLDGKDTGDYEQRVEPSVQGGQKMAEGLFRVWHEHHHQLGGGGGGGGGGDGAAALPDTDAADAERAL